MRPRFFSQKIEAKLPEKKMPSTAAKAIMRSPNVAVLLAIHCRAQSAFFFTQGRVSIALNRKSLLNNFMKKRFEVRTGKKRSNIFIDSYYGRGSLVYISKTEFVDPTILCVKGVLRESYCKYLLNKSE